MNFKHIFLTAALIPLTFASCKKDKPNTSDLAALNIVNGMSDNTGVYIYFTKTPTDFRLQQTPITNYNATEYSIPNGVNSISIVPADDSSKILIQKDIEAVPGTVYSAYLSGTRSQSELIVLTDTIPNIIDSAAAVRFINLIPKSETLSINLLNNSGTQEFTNLIYQNPSTFKHYATNEPSQHYTFEIREQKTGLLLTTFDWYFTFRKSNTLVISGDISASSNTIQILSVNNY